MMNPKDLTVVLTLKDRASFTYRWMRWMNEQKFPYKIIIADGGADKNIEMHLGDYQNYPDLDYEYIRYPYDSDADAYVRKIADVASKVSTKFVMAADNDDLILLNPLEENLGVMRDRDDVHSICPSQYRFRIHKDAESIDNLVCADNARIAFTRLGHVVNQALEDPSPLTRLFSVVEKFCSTFIYYGIHRADDYKRINHGLLEMRVKRFIFMEWYTSYVYAIAGKLILDHSKPYLVRQEDTSQCASSIYSVENHANIFLLRDWSGALYAMIDDLYRQCVAMGYEVDREIFEEHFREAFRKDMLSWMEFRGLANKFKKFPKLYAIGRKVFAFYRGNQYLKIADAELKRNQDLYRVYCFLKQYKQPSSSSIN
jgi:glycosyltransferase domain-containing protein